jgi:DNA-binding NarL/FixJ family response regulator
MKIKINILIVDDHPVLRKGLKDLLLEHCKTCCSVTEAENGESALNKISELNPDVTILDVEMPVMDGFQVLSEIQNKKLNTRVVILTAHKEEHYFNKAMDMGVFGYIIKDNAIEDVCDCIDMVLEDKYYISPEISTYLIKRLKSKEEFKMQVPTINDLTPSEKKILKYISENKTSREIADVLFISDQTVNKHRNNICEKLNIHGTHSLVKFAIENKRLL